MAGSIPLIVVGFRVEPLWPWARAPFVVGRIFQFVGHWVEGKPPELFQRFSLVGLGWRYAKLRG